MKGINREFKNAEFSTLKEVLRRERSLYDRVVAGHKQTY
jgi:hypothetical protein